MNAEHRFYGQKILVNMFQHNQRSNRNHCHKRNKHGKFVVDLNVGFFPKFINADQNAVNDTVKNAAPICPVPDTRH